MFDKKLLRPPTTLARSSSLSDLTFVCQDGLAYAHQFLLSKHSPYLKRFFTEHSTLVGVTLNQPRMKGLPLTLKEQRKPCPMVQVHLPDYTVLTVDLLLDLLYTGKTDQSGDIDQSMGQLCIRLLYNELGIEPECGGLPDIAELDTFEVEVGRQEVVQHFEEEIKEVARVKEVTRVALPAIEAATSTTVDTEISHAVDVVVSDSKVDDEEFVNLSLKVNSSETNDGAVNNIQTNRLDETSELEEQEDKLDEVSELLGGDDDDLLSDVEIELDDVDSETFEFGDEEMDSSISPDNDDSQCLKELANINVSKENDALIEKEKDFINELNKDFSDVDELNTSLDFENIIESSVSATKLVEEDRKASPCLVKKKIKLEKNSNEAKVDNMDLLSTQRNKIELKLSVCYSDKKRKRKGSEDADYRPKLKANKETSIVKRFGSRVTRSCSRDMEEKSNVSGDHLLETPLTIIPIMRKYKSDEMSVEAKLGSDNKVNKAEDSIICIKYVTPEFTESKIKTSKTNSPTPMSSSELINKPSNSVDLKVKKNQKAKVKEKIISKIPSVISCPIKGCSLKQNTSSSERSHPNIYYILKHLISDHLRKEPCRIYNSEDVKHTTKKLSCLKCTYSTESKTSLYTHLACYHEDLYCRMKTYLGKATSKEELDIYSSVETFLKRIWSGWKSTETLSTGECSVNLTVKDCFTCHEIFLSWDDLKNHVLVHHCQDKLDVYISGTEDAGYECKASQDCNVKFKDKISILHHLISLDHLIIKEKEIVDIAFGLQTETGDTKDLSIKINQDTIIPDCVPSVEISTEVEKDCAKIVDVFRRSRRAKELKKRKSRESFEIFGSPLQIIKEPSPAKEKKFVPTHQKANSQETEASLPNSTPMEVSSIQDKIPVKNQQCKFCYHNYIGDNDLRFHLLEKHADRFSTIPMLEAGEKYYECTFCIRKTKMRKFHINHLKKEHKMITLDLIQSEEVWKQGVLGHADFCVERDDSLDYMLHSKTWESNPLGLESSSHERSEATPVRSPDAKNYVPVPNDPTDDPEMETISDGSFNLDNCIEIDASSPETHNEVKSTARISEASSPKTKKENEPTARITRATSPKIIEEDKPTASISRASSPKTNDNIDPDSSDDEVIEEYVSITKRKPPKVRHRSRAQYACKVCDMLFPSGAKVSAHVFMFHLQRMSDTVWQELYTTTSNTKICTFCGDQQDRARLAKLHQYSQHKRELKKKMEEKGQDWRNLLDFIQHKVSEEMIDEEEITESEVESSSRTEVYDNPFYQDSGPSQPELLIQEAVETPPSAKISVPVVVVKNVPANTCGDESDSDDGVKVCMERRDVAVKKVDLNIDLLKEDNKLKDNNFEDTLPMSNKREESLDLCPFSTCNEIFEQVSNLVDHYLVSHPQSPMKLSLVKALAPERFSLNSSQKATINMVGVVRDVFSCPLCPVQFVELQLQARHVTRHSDPAAVQCDHCRNFVKVGEKEQHQNVCFHKGEWKRIQEIENRQKSSNAKTFTSEPLPVVLNTRYEENVKPSTSSASTVVLTTGQEKNKMQVPGKVYPCTHRPMGCKETFTDKAELHKHARKCIHRPDTSFACQHGSCTKRYYYKEDYEKHIARYHPPTSEAVPTTSTSSTSVICTPTLHTCDQCSAAFPSQQCLLEHTETTHQMP